MSVRLWLILVALGLAAWGDEARAQVSATRASGRSTDVVQVARTELFLGNNPADTGRLESLSRTLTSENPDWNQARVFSVRFADPYMRSERQMRGHMVVTHPGGDQTFLEYEFKWKPAVDGVSDFEMMARFLRGTGRFKGISGTWRERGQASVAADTSEWHVEYTVP
jgi:hypothetical protein